MHILALLVAAVFSSQFVAPNPIGTVTTTLTGITDYHLVTGLPTFKVTVPGITTEVMTFTLADTAAGTGVTKALTILSNTTDEYTFDEGEVAPDLVGKGTIYIIAIETVATTKHASPAITVGAASAWAISTTGTLKDTDLAKAPAFNITGYGTETWPTGLKATFSWTNRAGVKKTSAEINVENRAAPNHPILADQAISGLAILTRDFIGDKPIVLTVTLILDSAKNIVHPHTATINLVKNVPTWSMTPVSLVEADFDLTNKVFTIPTPTLGWALDTEVKITWSTTKTKPTVGALLTYDVVPGSGTPPITDPRTATVDLAAVGAPSADELYVYLSVKEAAGSAAYLDAPITVTYDRYTAPTGTFTMTPSTATYEELGSLGSAITFTQTEGAGKTTWGEFPTAKFANADDEEEFKILAATRTTASPNGVANIAINAKLNDLGIPISGGTIKVYLSPEANPKYLPAAATITVAAKLPVFTIGNANIPEASIAALAVELTPTGGAETTAWKAGGDDNVKATFTATKVIPNEDGAFTFPLTKPASGATAFAGTADLSNFPFGTPSNKLYVWAKVGAEWRDVPRELTYVPIVATFTVNTPAGIDEEDLAEPIAFEITPIPANAWATKTVVATISTSKSTPGSTPDYTEELVEPTGSATKWTASFDLSEIDPEDITEFLYVHVKVAAAAYDTYVAKIPFTPTAPDPFVVSTPTAITEAALEDPITFGLTPTDPSAWAGETVLITVSLTATAITAAEPPFTEELVEPTHPATQWTAAVDLSTIVVPSGQTKLYVHVKVGSAAYLTYVAEVTYTPSTPPPAVTYTLEPNEIAYAEDLKMAKTEIKPSVNHGWDPTSTTMKFRISNPTASPAPTPVTGNIEITTGKFYIPNETEIADLFAAAPTTNVVLKVDVSLDGTDYLSHKADFTVTVPGKPEAAMGVSPLLSLLAALVFLFVKLF